MKKGKSRPPGTNGRWFLAVYPALVGAASLLFLRLELWQGLAVGTGALLAVWGLRKFYFIPLESRITEQAFGEALILLAAKVAHAVHPKVGGEQTTLFFEYASCPLWQRDLVSRLLCVRPGRVRAGNMAVLSRTLKHQPMAGRLVLRLLCDLATDPATGRVVTPIKAWLEKLSPEVGMAEAEVVAAVKAVERQPGRAHASRKAEPGERQAPLPPPLIRSALGDGDPYEVLGVKKSASLAEVKKAYHRLVREVHPDTLEAHNLGAKEKDAAGEKTRLYNAAFDEISKKLKSDT